VCENVKDADPQGKEAGVQSLQHTIRNPDLAEVARCAPVGLSDNGDPIYGINRR
jgi:hypothetical protein